MCSKRQIRSSSRRFGVGVYKEVELLMMKVAYFIFHNLNIKYNDGQTKFV